MRERVNGLKFLLYYCYYTYSAIGILIPIIGSILMVVPRHENAYSAQSVYPFRFINFDLHTTAAPVKFFNTLVKKQFCFFYMYSHLLPYVRVTILLRQVDLLFY